MCSTCPMSNMPVAAATAASSFVDVYMCINFVCLCVLLFIYMHLYAVASVSLKNLFLFTCHGFSLARAHNHQVFFSNCVIQCAQFTADVRCAYRIEQSTNQPTSQSVYLRVVYGIPSQYIHLGQYECFNSFTLAQQINHFMYASHVHCTNLSICSAAGHHRNRRRCCCCRRLKPFETIKC